jgi:8-oxo-dGTP pyrophosphatase MutT (NUDIX family)
VTEEALRQAAVLIPFYRDGEGQLRVVLIRRTSRGRHAGQIAFPGGNREPGDGSPRATAMREACEELGLLAAQIEILAALPAQRTATSNYLVWPFVARLHEVSPAYTWRPQPSEVAEVLDVPVAELASPDAAGTEELSSPSWPAPRVVPVRYLRGHLVWGLTLRILEPVMRRALAGDWSL